MTPTKQAERIRQAYSDCLRLARQHQHQRGFGNWLEQACEQAGMGESQHRRAGDRWRMSIAFAAAVYVEEREARPLFIRIQERNSSK